MRTEHAIRGYRSPAAGSLSHNGNVRQTEIGMRIPAIREVTGITAIRDPDLAHGFAEIIISSPTADLRLRCDRNTDEIVLSRLRKRRPRGVRLLTGRRRVEWMWVLHNQQGYEDGFRIQVADKKGSRSFDFIAIASVIQVFEARELPNQQIHPIAGKPGSG